MLHPNMYLKGSRTTLCAITAFQIFLTKYLDNGLFYQQRALRLAEFRRIRSKADMNFNEPYLQLISQLHNAISYIIYIKQLINLSDSIALSQNNNTPKYTRFHNIKLIDFKSTSYSGDTRGEYSYGYFKVRIFQKGHRLTKPFSGLDSVQRIFLPILNIDYASL